MSKCKKKWKYVNIKGTAHICHEEGYKWYRRNSLLFEDTAFYLQFTGTIHRIIYADFLFDVGLH